MTTKWTFPRSFISYWLVRLMPSVTFVSFRDVECGSCRSFSTGCLYGRCHYLSLNCILCFQVLFPIALMPYLNTRRNKHDVQANINSHMYQLKDTHLNKSLSVCWYAFVLHKRKDIFRVKQANLKESFERKKVGERDS